MPSQALKDNLLNKIRAMDAQKRYNPHLEGRQDFAGFAPLFEGGMPEASAASPSKPPPKRRVDPVAEIQAKQAAAQSARDAEMRARLMKKTGVGMPHGHPVFNADMLDALGVGRSGHSLDGLDPAGLAPDELQWIQDQAEQMSSPPVVSPYRGAKVPKKKRR